VSQRGCIPWCNHEEKRLILPSCDICFSSLFLHLPASLQSKPHHTGQLQFLLSNNTNPNKTHITAKMGAVASCFNSVVSAITSCFMAIVNGIVTICKAIINGIVAFFSLLANCLTCGKAGGGRRKATTSAV
jgi:hypothetical protein